MPVRQELGCKTIFNILGPLTNPAGVKRQLTGAFAPDLIFPMAETLRECWDPKRHGWFMDQTGPTKSPSPARPRLPYWKTVNPLKDVVHPEDAGLPVHPLSAIRAAHLRRKRRRPAGIDGGGTRSAYRDAVSCLTRRPPCLLRIRQRPKAGVELARDAIDSGRAMKAINTLANITSEAA
jgi:anthranilate phosphoribosyltransferase